MVSRRIVFEAAIAAAAATLAGCTAPPVQAAAGRLVDLQIIDRSRGDVLPEYRHRGSAYVAGQPGNRYAVRLTNRSNARVLVVLSVDGINAVSGETAAVSQTGYVLAPWQTADITGWRKSESEAAAFYFTALPDSYAARTYRPHNVGVIGAAVFREHAPPPRPHEPMPYPRGRYDGETRQEGEQRADDSRRPSAEGAGARAEREAAATAAAPGRDRDSAPLAKAPSARLGTGHGEREYSPIGRTNFERASAYPAEVVQVRYDSHHNLIASGVIAPRRSVPDPFPGYVPDPPS